MRPFVYPTAKHVRGPAPGPYKNYRTYKPFLKVEFENKCVYCRVPDTLRGPAAFAVEHYKPKKRFPASECDYANLFYACQSCNSFKGQYWPTPADRLKRCVIPNPCDDVMSTHLRYQGSKVSALTPNGTFTIDLLELADAHLETFRDAIVAAVRAEEAVVQGLQRLINAAQLKLASAPAAQQAQIQTDLSDYRTMLTRAMSRLGVLQGV